MLLTLVGKALKVAQEIKPSFMVEEVPQEAALRGDGLVKAKSVSLAEAEAFEGVVGDLDYTVYLDWQDPGVARQYAKMERPPMVANITGTGCYSKSTAEARGQLDELETMTYGPGAQTYGSGPWMVDRKVALGYTFP